MLKGIGESMGLGNLAELLSIDDKEFWKGAALGATIALLATNDGVKENLMATVARLMATMKATANGGDSNPEKEEFDHSGGTGSEPSA
ncbi:MAG: hypothetical protein CSB48_10990 [Proteobacteria bacterium]|nr:MAG: hypothetical protein CSB48_10990 [Pseudomonadota bacterium]